MKALQMLLIGIFVSYIGTLPPGIINMQSVKYQLGLGYSKAKIFIIGAITFEFLQVLVSVVFLKFISTFFDNNILIFHSIALCVLLVFCVSSIIRYRRKSYVNKEIQPRMTEQNFLLNGIKCAFLNVLIYPFYSGIGLYLINYQIAEAECSFLIWLIFAVGTAIGTYLCLMTYLKIGHQIIKNKPNFYAKIYLVLALTFLILACLQLTVILSLL